MKTCPVCNALAFDDADTCFGCLHSFADEPEHKDTPHVESRTGSVPEFLIKFTPMTDRSGSVTWSCAVETS